MKKRKKLIVTLLIILVPIACVALLILLWPESYSITTEKDSAFNKKVERVLIIATIDENLKLVFEHSFKHSILSALQSNDVNAIIVDAPSASNSFTDYGKEAETFAPDSQMRIKIDHLNRTGVDGYNAIDGVVFEASLTDAATEKQIWHATGKVDPLADWRGHGFAPNEGATKEFAWNTAAAIVRAFVADVNGRKPAKIYTNHEDRQSHGQRVD